MNASRFEHGAHATTSDEAGTDGRRTEKHFAAVVFTEDFMRNRAALELHGHHAFLGGLGGLLDGVGDLVGLAVADAHIAFAITYDGKRRETETTTALHDLGAAIDEHDLLKHAGLARVGTVVVRARAGRRTSAIVIHGQRLELKATFAGSVGEGFHATVEETTIAVEHHGANASGFGLGGKG